MIKTDNEFVYDMSPLMEYHSPEPYEMHPQQGNFPPPQPPHYYQQHNQAQQIRQQQHYLQLREEQQRHMQHQQQIRQQQLMRQEQLRQQNPPQTFHQSAFRSNLPQFQQQTGWQRVHAPTVRFLPRPQPIDQRRPLIILQKRPPNWTFHNHSRPPPPPMLHPIMMQDELPPLVPIQSGLSPLSEENFNQVPTHNDDFKDFDVTDLLRLSFDDDIDNSNRKRKGHPAMYGSHMIKRRRTRAEIIAEKNILLKRQCVKLSISCEKLETPSHVRIFGSNILRGNLPNVPNMKLTPKNIDFNRIRNIGYLVTKKGVCFSCLTSECKFKSYDQEKFREHLNKYHGIEASGTIEGYCEMCKRNCCGYNVVDEFIHVMKYHLKSIDDHPMHQILYSHVKRKTRIVDDDYERISIFDELDSDLIDILFEDDKADKTVLTNDFDDDDYRPSSSDDEAQSEISDEIVHESSDDEEAEESEAKSTSGEEEEEEEEEVVNYASSDSEKEHRKRKKTQTQTVNSNEDDIPQYVLERIKLNSSFKSNDSDTKIQNASFTEVIEELINEEVPEFSKTHKKKKKKQRSQNFACKSTSKCLETFSVISPKALPTCRVVLTRCDVEKSETTENQPRESLKMVIKRNEKDPQIAVPDIPTPPSSEDSRDSLSTPPLNNKNIERTTETMSQKTSPIILRKTSKLIEDVNLNETISNDKAVEKEINQNEIERKNEEFSKEPPLISASTNEEEKLSDSNDNLEEINESDEKIEKKENPDKNENPDKSEDEIESDRKESEICDDLEENEEIVNLDSSNEIENNNADVCTDSENIENPTFSEKPKIIIESVEILGETSNNIEEEPIVIGSQESVIFIDEAESSKVDSQKSEIIDVDAIITKRKIGSEIINVEESIIDLDVERPRRKVEDKNSIIVLDDYKEVKSEVIDVEKESEKTPDCIEIQDDDEKSEPINPKSATMKNIEKAKGIVNSIRNYFSSQKPSESETSSSENIQPISNDSNDLTEFYPWIDSKITSEVFKTQNCIQEMKNEFYQFSTYKCMNDNCSFFTTDFEKFKIHLKIHNDEHNFCSFCLYDADNADDLCNHIEKLHNHDRYQCNLCMYRSCEKVYVEWHQQRFHKNLKGKILKSPVQALMKSVRTKIQNQLKNENWDKFVKPYDCKIAECKKVFYCKENYRKHLTEKSIPPNMEQCSDKIFEELNKLDQTHCKDLKFGINQCLYCEYGSDLKDDIQVHMTDNHPHELGFICRRKLSIEIAQDSNETLEDSTIIEYIGHSSFKVKFYTDDRAKLSKNDEGTSKSRIQNVDDDKMTSEIIDLIDQPTATSSKIIHLDTS